MSETQELIVVLVLFAGVLITGIGWILEIRRGLRVSQERDEAVRLLKLCTGYDDGHPSHAERMKLLRAERDVARSESTEMHQALQKLHNSPLMAGLAERPSRDRAIVEAHLTKICRDLYVSPEGHGYVNGLHQCECGEDVRSLKGHMEHHAKLSASASQAEPRAWTDFRAGERATAADLDGRTVTGIIQSFFCWDNVIGRNTRARMTLDDSTPAVVHAPSLRVVDRPLDGQPGGES